MKKKLLCENEKKITLTRGLGISRMSVEKKFKNILENFKNSTFDRLKYFEWPIKIDTLIHLHMNTYIIVFHLQVVHFTLVLNI